MDKAMKIIRCKLGRTPVKFRVIPWYQNRRKGTLRASILMAEANEIIMVADKRGDVAQTPVFRGYLYNGEDSDDDISENESDTFQS